MIKKMVVALAGVATFGVAHASTWFLIPFGTDNYHYSIDLDSIRKQHDGSMMAWFKVDYGKAPALKGHPYTSAKTRVRAFCEARLLSNGPTYWYSGNGDVVDSSESISPAQEVVPDSIGEGLFKSACFDWTPVRQGLRANPSK
jgi:hypothetical protein